MNVPSRTGTGCSRPSPNAPPRLCVWSIELTCDAPVPTAEYCRRHPARRTACRSSSRCRPVRSSSRRGCRSSRLRGTRKTCTARSVFRNVHVLMSILEPMPFASSATANRRSNGVMISPLTRSTVGLIHDSPGPVAPDGSATASPNCARNCGPSAPSYCGRGSPLHGRSGGADAPHDVVCVRLLQPPAAGLGDGSMLPVRSGAQHLGADQLDLFTGALQR